MRFLFLILGLLLAVGQEARRGAPPLTWQPQHPQIHDARTFYEWDYDSREIVVVVAVDIVDDGAGWWAGGQSEPSCAAAYTVYYRSARPPAPYEVTWRATAGEPCEQGSQLPLFVTYLGSALGCEDVDLSFYDAAGARNGRSPQSIVDLARDLSQLRSYGLFGCGLPPLPPRG